MAMNHFKSDPNYFLKYFTLNFLCFATADALMVWVIPNAFNFRLNSSYLLVLIPLGVIVGFMSATAFHNASHGNINPRWLNTLVGELTASFSLDDIRSFRVGHLLHHVHADDPELDPHPPKGLSFLRFIWTSRRRTIDCIAQFYFRHHGSDSKSELNVKAQIRIYHLAAFAKLFFWFLLFGPAVFVLFFVPAYLSFFLGFAHLNYISHLVETDDGHVRNHHGTPFYAVMNLITSGGYYHKNHHLAPGLYNPSKLRSR